MLFILRKIVDMINLCCALTLTQNLQIILCLTLSLHKGNNKGVIFTLKKVLKRFLNQNSSYFRLSFIKNQKLDIKPQEALVAVLNQKGISKPFCT
jgi:hypothetical protein